MRHQSAAVAARPGLTPQKRTSYTNIVLQLSFNKATGYRRHAPTTLGELRVGEQGVLDRLDLPEGDARRLMELGFPPGSTVLAARRAPGGDPRVFRVDGSEVALRTETASRIALRPAHAMK